MADRGSTLTSNHWGVGLVETDGERITAVGNHPRDPAPNRLNENIPDSLYGPGRITDAHTDHELLERASFERAIGDYVRIARELCG